MAKLSLTPEETFDAVVQIPVPGAKAAPVKFKFKWRSRPQVQEWLDTHADASDAEFVASATTGWDLDDQYTPENIERLCSAYAGAGAAVVAAYLQELGGAARGR
jgi:hypothetical protein